MDAHRRGAARGGADARREQAAPADGTCARAAGQCRGAGARSWEEEDVVHDIVAYMYCLFYVVAVHLIPALLLTTRVFCAGWRFVDLSPYDAARVKPQYCEGLSAGVVLHAEPRNGGAR